MKLNPFFIQLLILCVLQGPVSYSAPLYSVPKAPSPDKRANPCSRPLTQPLTRFGSIRELLKAFDIYEMSLELPPLWNNLKTPELNRIRTYYNHMFDSTAALLENRTKYLHWVLKMRLRIIEAAARDGVPCLALAKQTAFEKYLDQVIAEQGAKYGFNLTSEGKPFVHMSKDNYEFLERLSRKELFFDKGMAKAAIHLDNVGMVYHGLRSHALQMIFVAEHIPNFVNKIAYIGRIEESVVWNYLFDNPEAYGITNNGIFEKYTLKLLAFNEQVCSGIAQSGL